MLKHQVNTEGKALAYILDCTLATVEHMAITKSRKQGEYKRQIGIAQSALDWAIGFGVDVRSTRARKVQEHHGSVEAWAKSFEVSR